MTKADKATVIEELKEKFESNEYFYITDASTLSVAKTTELRRAFFEKGIEMKVVKNTLARKALEALPEENNYSGVFDALKGPTALLFSPVANAPARVIKEFRKTSDRPIIKAAYIQSAVYHGDEQLDALTKLKSKEELLGDLLGLLGSPMQNLMGALNSGGNNISGLLKALEERAA
jgi:large subunit ribosomal protein L10